MKAKDKKTILEDFEKEIAGYRIIDKIDEDKPQIYAGSEEKLLNLVVEIIVKIIKKEVL